MNSYETHSLLQEVSKLSNQGTPVASAASSAGRLRTAALITPQPTVDLALLSGSLLHLDLCINVPFPLLSLFSFLFLLSWRCWTQNVDESDHGDALRASGFFVVRCHCSATPVGNKDTAVATHLHCRTSFYGRFF